MQTTNLEIGIAFANNNNHKKAVEFLSRSILEEGETTEAYENRGFAYYGLNQVDIALEDFTKAIELAPLNENALLNRGNIYLERKEFDKAFNDYLAAYQINNTHLDVIANLVYIYTLRKDFQKADELCDELLKFSSYYKWGIKAKINIQFDQKKYNKAISVINSFLYSYPDDSEMLNYKGFCYLILNELDLAETFFKRSLNRDPVYAFPVNNLGYIEYLKKEYNKALTLINESLTLDPSNSFAYKNLALVFIALDQKAEAHKALLTAQELGFQEYFGNEVEELLTQHF